MSNIFSLATRLSLNSVADRLDVGVDVIQIRSANFDKAVAGG